MANEQYISKIKLPNDETIYHIKDARPETDPVFTASPAATITQEMINNWNNPSGGITNESDPVYSASAAATITSDDITNWNNKLDAPSTQGSSGQVLATDGDGDVYWTTINQETGGLKMVGYDGFTAGDTIYLGTVAPASVNTTGWKIGQLYVYVTNN